MIKPKNIECMKTRLLILIVGIALSLSCSKQKTEVAIDEKNLTSCEDNASCKYLFAEKSDLDIQSPSLKAGNYRLFIVENTKGPSTTKLFIKAPMTGNQFSLSDKDVLDGRVLYTQLCPSCDYVDVKAVGGYVKGKNLTPEKPANQSKWLIEANVMMEAVGDATVKHTLHVKQYFTPNF
jgi:hypothetical protein